MQKLMIHKLGPIEQCELECSRFMVFTGFQASGKSTIAKAIYYFRTIKEDILELAKIQAFKTIPVNGLGDGFEADRREGLKKALENYLREKFLRTFGSSWGMPNGMYMEYHFTKTCFIKISLKNDMKYAAPNYIWITFSPELKGFLQEKNNCFSATALGIADDKLTKFKIELNQIFDDSCSVVYIPAGRSMITLL